MHEKSKNKTVDGPAHLLDGALADHSLAVLGLEVLDLCLLSRNDGLELLEQRAVFNAFGGRKTLR